VTGNSEGEGHSFASGALEPAAIERRCEVRRGGCPQGLEQRNSVGLSDAVVRRPCSRGFRAAWTGSEGRIHDLGRARPGERPPLSTARARAGSHRGALLHSVFGNQRQGRACKDRSKCPWNQTEQPVRAAQDPSRYLVSGAHRRGTRQNPEAVAPDPAARTPSNGPTGRQPAARGPRAGAPPDTRSLRGRRELRGGFG